MTPLAWTLFAVAAILAVIDWAAVQREDLRLESRAKPAVIVALIAVAAALDPSSESQRVAFLIALGLSLTRDVLTLGGERHFVAAVAASLAAHAAYVVGFQQVGWSWLWARPASWSSWSRPSGTPSGSSSASARPARC